MILLCFIELQNNYLKWQAKEAVKKSSQAMNDKNELNDKPTRNNGYIIHYVINRRETILSHYMEGIMAEIKRCYRSVGQWNFACLIKHTMSEWIGVKWCEWMNAFISTYFINCVIIIKRLGGESFWFVEKNDNLKHDLIMGNIYNIVFIIYIICYFYVLQLSIDLFHADNNLMD